MIMENDKFEIPEEYKNMSVEELKKEKEKLYVKLAKNRASGIQIVTDVERICKDDADKLKVIFKYDYLANMEAENEIN